MIPVDQEVGNPTSNCFDACLASVLEMPMANIPEYVDDAVWLEDYNRWLKPLNLQIMALSFKPIVPQGYAILVGHGNRHLDHAVVTLNGEMVHDPHCDRKGLIEGTEDYWLVFAVLNPRPAV